MSKHADSTAHVLGGLHARRAIDPKAQTTEPALALARADNATVDDARLVLAALTQWGATESADVLRKEVGDKWPEAVL